MDIFWCRQASETTRVQSHGGVVFEVLRCKYYAVV